MYVYKAYQVHKVGQNFIGTGATNATSIVGIQIQDLEFQLYEIGHTTMYFDSYLVNTNRALCTNTRRDNWKLSSSSGRQSVSLCQH